MGCLSVKKIRGKYFWKVTDNRDKVLAVGTEGFPSLAEAKQAARKVFKIMSDVLQTV